MLSRIFHDKRCVALIFFAWSCFVLSMFAYMGIMSSSFVHFGPSSHIKFLNYQIDTWSKWSIVALFTLLDSFMLELAHEAIYPWEINSVLDPKTKTLPYSKAVCICIIESYYLHGLMVGPFTFWIHVTQLDFVLIKSTVVTLTHAYSHYQYIKDKEF